MNPSQRAHYGLDRLDPYAPGEAWYEANRRMQKDGLRGSVVIAPAQVELPRRDTLPFAILSILDGPPAIPANAKSAMLVTRVESRTTWCVPLREPRERPARPRAPQDPNEKRGVSLDVTYFDIRSRIPELPWRPGTLVLRVVRDGFETDAVVIHLVAGAIAEDESARTILETRRAPALPAPPPPPRDADAGWSAETPNVPDPDGLDLFLDVLDPVGDTARIIARGGYTLPVRQIELTPRNEVRTTPDGKHVAASLPLTFVVTGPELLDPVVIPVRIDSHVLVTADGWPTPVLPAGDVRPRARGQFNLNLTRFDEFPRVPGAYWVRAIVGSFDTGPQPYTVLDETLAPLIGDEPG